MHRRIGKVFLKKNEANIYSMNSKKSTGCLLIANKVIVEKSDIKSQLIQKGFGEKEESGELILDLKEAAYLLKNKKIVIKDREGKNVSSSGLLKYGQGKEAQFYPKFLVYSDLRERGYVVKTGFKFGFDFRVYPKGKKAGQAHTQWVVNAATQDTKFTMPELSRLVRLSGNIRTIPLQAVVDSENDINYYSMERVTP
jgi:tRNA-intron endonuclease, archaea type